MNPGSVPPNMKVAKKPEGANDVRAMASPWLAMQCNGPSTHFYNVFQKPGNYIINVASGGDRSVALSSAAPPSPNKGLQMAGVTSVNRDMRAQGTQTNSGGESSPPQGGGGNFIAPDKTKEEGGQA